MLLLCFHISTKKHSLWSLVLCNFRPWIHRSYLPTVVTAVRVITARVRSTREGNVLTRVCVSVHSCWGGRGGVPHLRSCREGGLGTPSQVWPGGECPIPGLARGGVPHSRSGRGVPHPRSEWGTPQTWDRVTPLTWDRVPPQTRPGMGYPPRPGMGYPPQTWDRVPPRPDLGWGTPPDLGWGTPPDLE